MSHSLRSGSQDHLAFCVMLLKLCNVSMFDALLSPHPVQAVNKLAEIMNKKDLVRGIHHADDSSLRRKEKENRKLQLELRSEREKLNSTIIRYQREISEMQAVSKNISEHGFIYKIWAEGSFPVDLCVQ